MALRRLRDEDSGEVTNTLAVVLPPVVAVIVLLVFPSIPTLGGRLFRQDGLVTAVIVILLAAIVVLGVVASKLEERWLVGGNRFLRHAMAFLVGGLLACSVILGNGLRLERVQQLAAEERAAKQHAEEDKQRAENNLKSFSADVARQQMLQFSHEKMQELEKNGSLKGTSQSVETIPVGNKHIQVTRKNAHQNASEVVYRAEGEPLPEPVEIMLNKETGQLKVEGSSENPLRFYAAVVKKSSGDTITLSIKDEHGNESDLSWALNALSFQPTIGQRLFVVVDPKTSKPVEVTQFKPDAKKDETVQPK
jgi:hypothetical protein